MNLRAILVSLSVSLAFFALPAGAATPASGTVSPDNPSVSYEAGPFLVSNVTGTVTGLPVCNTPATPCDSFTLNVSLPADYAQAHPDDVLTIRVTWPNQLNDFDMYVLDDQGNQVDRAASSADPETVILPAGSGDYQLTILVAPFTVTAESFQGDISLGPIPPGVARAPGIAPRYQVYEGPLAMHQSQNEPSIGFDRESGRALYQNLLDTLSTGFNDSTSPAMDDWREVGSQITSTEGLDPILFTDHDTNRTFVSQLLGVCSAMAYSDDGGDLWVPSEGCGPGALADHQTVGGGPFAPPLTGGTPAYPDAVYYCAQAVASAQCAVSLDGGQTFGPGVSVYTADECGGLHGHIKVGPDGTAYLPNEACFAHQAVVVSEDNGQSWDIRTIPGSVPGDGTDPSVGIATDGTVYFGYENADGRPHIAVSHDHGQTWENDADVGDQVGVVGAVFPAVVAGDPDRAAFAFLGTTTKGDFTSSDFEGVWHLYIAHTFDGGESWVTVDATPNDPVQRGCIWLGGGGNPCRNLLDFMDATIDPQGRVLVGFADGCIGHCSIGPPNTFGAHPAIARQSGGRRMYAQFDPVEPAVPAPPRLDVAEQSDSGVALDWKAPDNGGSGITGYRIYRGASPGDETLLASVGGSKTTFSDGTALAGNDYFYRVSAVNDIGEGQQGNELEATPAPPATNESACTLPGVTVVSDDDGDQAGAPANTQLDIQSVSVAEPYFPDGSSKLAFVIKVADLSVVPAGARWQVDFVTPDNVQHFVDMNTESGTPVFEYGHNGSVVLVGTNETDGAADPESGYNQDGTIVIVVSNDKIGGPAAGQALDGIQGTTKLEVSADGSGRRVVTADDALLGSYVLVGNQNCQATQAPIAALSADPTSGFAPLTVRFDGSDSSDPDPNDSVASYTFDFGDGSEPATQDSPTIDHTYQQPGTYQASLTVTDTNGMQSDPDTVTITVDEAPAGPSQVKGGGYLKTELAEAGGKVNFSFQVDSSASGHMNYNDNQDGISFNTDAFDSYAQNGQCATFSGTAELKHNGGHVSFQATACDNGQPGRDVDEFSIDITGDAESSRSGKLAGGDIKLIRQ